MWAGITHELLLDHLRYAKDVLGHRHHVPQTNHFFPVPAHSSLSVSYVTVYDYGLGTHCIIFRESVAVRNFS